MKLYSPDKSDLMEVSRLERKGNNIIVHGKIMGSMPMKAVVRPDEARKIFKLLDLKLVLFFLTFLLRKAEA